MKAALQGLLPRLLPDDVHFTLVPHEGKSDLEKSIPRKLRAWKTPDTSFVVLRDQDAGDCVAVKARLQQLCVAGGRPDTLVRVVCRELESWFLGDLAAVEAGTGAPVARLQNKQKFRAPDKLGSPSSELAGLVPRYGKVGGARAIGPHLDLNATCSHSFAVFVQGVRRLVEEAITP